MNNIKNLSIILLLSLGVSGSNFANCDTGCSTTCSTNDCNNSNDCDDNDCCRTSTFFRPRSITTDLSYRNDLTFYNRYHDARCNFFTWDSTFAFQETRKGNHLAKGFLGGNNPITIAQTDGDINSLNLGIETPDFSATFGLCPERRTFAWMSQLIFNLDCFCTGLWADVNFSVLNVRHRLRLSDSSGGVITDALNARGVLFNSPNHNNNNGDCDNGDCNNNSADCDTGCNRTGVDDVLLRLGYDWNYCGNDHAGVYFLGIAPTGKKFNNARWFQPVIGSKHGAVGAGFTADYTIWNDECSNSDLVAMTELMYAFRFRHNEERTFDLNNGPLSRFLLVATEQNPTEPLTTLSDVLTTCVKVEPRHEVQWWLGFHYQWCNWGFEGAYNLYWRDHERICGGNFDFDDLGLFDKVCGNVVSDSNATIGGNFPTTTSDATFVRLTAADVDLHSAEAKRQFSHKITGAFSYNNVWCDCYPWYVGIGGGYEFASRKERCSTPENWNVFGKAAISF